MTKTKLIMATGLGILSIVLIVQNTEMVETEFILWSFTMPRAVLLLISTLLGFVVGVLVSLATMKKKKAPRKA